MKHFLDPATRRNFPLLPLYGFWRRSWNQNPNFPYHRVSNEHSPAKQPLKPLCEKELGLSYGIRSHRPRIRVYPPILGQNLEIADLDLPVKNVCGLGNMPLSNFDHNSLHEKVRKNSFVKYYNIL